MARIALSLLVLLSTAGCHEPPSAPVSAVATPIARSTPDDHAVAPARAVDPGCAPSVEQLPPSPLYDPADSRLRAPNLLVAHKSARRLMLFRDGLAHRCLPMGLGFAPEGHKHHEGDGRTPEGWYRTSDKPWSDFPGAIAIHYPNHDDAAVAQVDGRLGSDEHAEVVAALDEDLVPPQQTAMGGEVLIHGGGSREDWTLGCMALDDADLARLRADLPEDKRVSLLVLP